MTVSDGNLIGGFLARNKRSPRWGAASIEAAEESRRAHQEGDAEKRLFCFSFQRVAGFLIAPLNEGGLTGFDMLGTV